MTSAGSIAPSQPTVPLQQDATIIGLVGLAHASSHFSHLLLPLMFPVFIKEFGLSYCAAGSADDGVFCRLGPGPGQCRFVVDRMGARPVLFVALGIFVLACCGASRA
jgi:FSR family fosmidomycin resistance protein-like MFS transporter